MTIRLTGSTSGYTEVTAPAVAGSNTLVLPGGNGTADQALVTNGSGTLSFADRGRMVLETVKNPDATTFNPASLNPVNGNGGAHTAVLYDNGTEAGHNNNWGFTANWIRYRPRNVALLACIKY